jgi:hypothetical protein
LPAAARERFLTIEVIYLEPDQQSPEEEFWMLVEADGSGAYLATGAGRAPDGSNVYYSERDIDLNVALESAKGWGIRRNIKRIYVQKTP